MLSSKGIFEAVTEKNPVKALNSFAIRDIIDDIDSPLIEISATVSVGVELSLELVSIGVKGRLTIVVGEILLSFLSFLISHVSTHTICTYILEIDLFDPFPETSGGLVRVIVW